MNLMCQFLSLQKGL
uniref:Uncharacterized protein n=1 Tax=Arundo donax TaxID=35708 RepID=A0A0A8YLA1_ARUDO